MLRGIMNETSRADRRYRALTAAGAAPGCPASSAPTPAPPIGGGRPAPLPTRSAGHLAASRQNPVGQAIAIFVLRDGAVDLPNTRGDLILLRAPGANVLPFQGVAEISEQRTTFALWQQQGWN
jgi:hypothetical protein